MNGSKAVLWTKEYVIIALMNFFIALSFYLLMIIVVEYAMKRFASPPSEAGFVASIFVIGALIARVFAGRWITRFGYERMLRVGVVAFLAMMLLYFGANNVMSLLVVRFFHGMAFGITSTATATIISDIIPRERSGEGIAYYSLSQTLATAIGPFIGMFLSQHGSYNNIFATCSLVSAVCLLLLPVVKLRKTESAPDQKDVGRRFALNNFIEPKVIPISSLNMLFFLCYSSIVSFLAVYAKEIQLVNAAGFFFIVYAVAVTISRPVVGRLFDLKGENTIMYPAILVFAAGMLLFSQSHHDVTLLLSAALVGLGFGAIQSSTQTIAVKIPSRERMGLANSTYFLCADVGMGIGPLVVGFIIPFTGYRGMYFVVAIIALACLSFYYFVHGRTAPKHGGYRS